MKQFLLALSFLVAFASSAAADQYSPKQQAIVDNGNKLLKRFKTDAVNRACKSKIEARIEWKGFLAEIGKTIDKDDVDDIYSYCGAPLAQLQDSCSSDGFEKNVQQQVQSYVCKLQKKGASSMSLKGKELAMTMKWQPQREHRRWAELATLATLRAGEFTLGQAKVIGAENAKFEKSAVGMMESCGYKLTTSIEWKSFLAEVDKRVGRNNEPSIQLACGAALDGLERVCRLEKKSLVKKNVKSFVCVFGGPKKQKLSLRKGLLTYRVDLGTNAGDNTTLIRAFLVKKKIAAKKAPSPKGGAATLRGIVTEDNKARGSVGRCKTKCARKCSGASNKSRCHSQCRKACEH